MENAAAAAAMVCLAAAVLTKGGKVLIARQFVEMPRMRIENLLASFPKLVGADKQHNTVETAEVPAPTR